MDDNKIFSVIIPVYNGEKTIQRTLASLISSKDYIKEVIIVDDHSTDSTVGLEEPFGSFFNIEVVTSDGFHNPGMARKTGLLRATGEWVTFVDADDCLTPSSLRYVKDNLEDNIVLLYCQSIYYESGNFKPEDIEHSDGSCGGNFYKKDYLIEHGLFPHETLRMSEDEYFNTKIRKYLEYIEESDLTYGYYDYPVYEVHHDIEDGKSFALSNWADYLVRYHLQSQMYLVKDFIKYDGNEEWLKTDYMNNLIFAYYLLQGLESDPDEKRENIKRQYKYFNLAIKYFTFMFKCKKEDIIKYYYKNTDLHDMYYEGAKGSVGMDFKPVDFKQFINRVGTG